MKHKMLRKGRNMSQALNGDIEVAGIPRFLRPLISKPVNLPVLVVDRVRSKFPVRDELVDLGDPRRHGSRGRHLDLDRAVL